MPETIESSTQAGWRVVFPAAKPAGTGEAGGGIDVGLQSLGAAAEEMLFPSATPAGAFEGVTLFRDGELLLGHAVAPLAGGEIAARTQELYRRVLAAAGERELYRVWNYVPAINAETAGLENYRAFCAGRSLAFETALGAGFERRLPAASAVGCDGGVLTVMFAAGAAVPRHVENPEQVPAYFYPREHGPRAPSFARATVVSFGRRELTFISGTAAIKGHATIAPDALEAQLACTLDNLRVISRRAGSGEDLGAARGMRRHFKVYVRHAADFPAVRARLEAELVSAGDEVIYLRSDICRAALRVEIEATLIAER